MANEEGSSDTNGSGSGGGESGDGNVTSERSDGTNAARKSTDGHPNGSATGFSDENAEVGSDDCGDKMATENDPLQPKMVKSKSAQKVNKEVDLTDCNCW